MSDVNTRWAGAGCAEVFRIMKQEMMASLTVDMFMTEEFVLGIVSYKKCANVLTS